MFLRLFRYVFLKTGLTGFDEDICELFPGLFSSSPDLCFAPLNIFVLQASLVITRTLRTQAT